MKWESRNDGKPENSISPCVACRCGGGGGGGGGQGGIKSVTDGITDNLEAVYPSRYNSYVGV